MEKLQAKYAEFELVLEKSDKCYFHRFTITKIDDFGVQICLNGILHRQGEIRFETRNLSHFPQIYYLLETLQKLASFAKGEK